MCRFIGFLAEIPFDIVSDGNGTKGSYKPEVYTADTTYKYSFLNIFSGEAVYTRVLPRMVCSRLSRERPGQFLTRFHEPSQPPSSPPYADTRHRCRCH